MPHVRIALALALGLLPGCWAETDRRAYEVDDLGVVTFSNGSSETLWFGGCSPHAQERWDGAAWVDEGPDWQCVWEGPAQPLAGRQSRRDGFQARSPGTWRLAFRVGHGCTAGAPLAEDACQRIETVHSNRFQVEASAAEQACLATGGTWDPLSCGHYACGQRPLCLAIIPGCNCGPSSVFVEGAGCVAAPCGAPGDRD